MTEKIIIDGVDVSGCICLDEWKHCDICHTLIKNRKLEEALDEITDICCAKTKNCHMGCFICSTKCDENKILDIINKAKEVNNAG